MEPHHVLFGLLVVNHFGAFQDAPLGDGMGIVPFHHFQGDSLVLPVVQVLGGIAVDTHLGVVARVALHLVFPVPVVGPLVVEDAAAVGVDVDAVVVRPDFSGLEGSVLDGGVRRGKDGGAAKQEEGQQRFDDIGHGSEDAEVVSEWSGWPYSLSHALERAYRA